MWRWGLYFGSGFGSNGETTEKYTAFLPLLIRNPHGTSRRDFIESSCPENPICRRHVHILAWVTLQSSDVHRFFPLKMGMTLADVTADLSSLILLSIKLHIFLSFFEWWAFQETDTVSVHVLGSGSLKEETPMCSLQGRCSCSVTFSNVPRQRSCPFWIHLTASFLEDLLRMEQ